MELAIESVGEQSSVAISDAGLLLAEITWVSGRRHTPSLVPMIDRVSALADPNGEAHSTRDALKTVIGRCRPGALRRNPRRHGRGDGPRRRARSRLRRRRPARDPDLRPRRRRRSHRNSPRQPRRLGLAVLRRLAERLGPTSEPTLGTIDELLDQLSADQRRGVVCGDTELLDESQRDDSPRPTSSVGGAALNVRRASLLAELGYQRWLRGEAVAPGALEPLYLREPAIGPQPPPALPKNEG